MHKPVSLNNLSLSDEYGNVIVTEEYSIVFNSDETAEKFIQERKIYWQGLLNMKLMLSPSKSETIKEIEIRKLFRHVAKAMDMPTKYIIARNRSGPIIEARRIGIRICHDLGLGNDTIAKAIKLHRTNIYHHKKKCDELFEVEPGFKEKYESIKDTVLTKLNGQFNDDGSGEKINP